MTSPVTIGACVGMHPPMNTQVGLSSPDFGLLPAPLGYEMPAGSSGESSSSDTRSPEAPMPKASDRESRIRAEKQRRSQYNAQISQMMTLLSDVVHSQRKIDKTSVLRLAANKLRNEHVFGNSIKCGHVDTWSSSFMKIFDLFGGVMLGVTCRGRIFIVSPNVQEKLGYSHIDLLGQDLFNYVYPEDKDILTHNIYPSELQQNPCDERLLQGRRNFTIRIMRAGTRSDPPRYESCRIDGMLRRSDRATSNTVQNEQIIRRPRVRHTRTFPSSGNDYVFIGMIYFQTQTALPPRILPPTAYSEYWTRHLIDGRIVQCDQSISLAIGYMTEEVTGTSAFVFMHKDDVRWVICVLRQMYDQNKEFGESYYRLMSRSGHFTYMRTRGFLEIDRDTKQVQSFVCVNNVIGEDYGKRMMADMKRKYSVVVDLDQLEEQESNDDIPVEHPKQMERIVMHLLEPATSDVVNEKLKLVPPSKENIISAIKSSERVVQETGVRFDSRKRKSSDWEGNGDYLKRRNKLLDITDL